MNEKAGSVKHIHFSSRYLLSMSGGDNVEEKYCLSCKKAHAANPTKRVKLVLSDSTLHMFFAPPANVQHRADYEGDAIHTEYVTIPGARVEVLQQAFRIEYEVETRGIDVLLVAGLNNLLKGEKGEELMYKLCNFRDTVMRQSLKYHQTPRIPLLSLLCCMRRTFAGSPMTGRCPVLATRTGWRSYSGSILN